MENNDDRKKSEKEFHDDYFSGKRKYRKKQLVFYPKFVKKKEQEYIFDIFGEMKDKKILIYGIGNQTSLIRDLVDNGAEVIAIDISSESVKIVREKILENNYENKAKVIEMDCEDLTFEPNYFDFIFGRAIIHHLDIEKSIKQIQKVLKKGGKFGFIEPLATNPIIKIYRNLTPKDRTTDEHPLKTSDLLSFKKSFCDIHFKFIYALTLLSYPIRMLTNNEFFFFRVYNFLEKVDKLLNKLKGYRFLCWSVVITGEKKT